MIEKRGSLKYEFLLVCLMWFLWCTVNMDHMGGGGGGVLEALADVRW